jgi:hypothetical protein
MNSLSFLGHQTGLNVVDVLFKLDQYLVVSSVNLRRLETMAMMLDLPLPRHIPGVLPSSMSLASRNR